MTAEQRKQLEDAMVASQLENLCNVDSIKSLSDEVERAMRHGQRGFAEMPDDELLDVAKRDIGYDAQDAGILLEAAKEGEVPDPSVEKLEKLMALIHEIEGDRR